MGGRIDEQHTLTEDTLFTSPSTAASFVLFSSQNGLMVWTTGRGVPLRALDLNVETAV